MKFLPSRPAYPPIKMAEIYSGTARMAASFASMGVEAWAWDIQLFFINTKALLRYCRMWLIEGAENARW